MTAADPSPTRPRAERSHDEQRTPAASPLDETSTPAADTRSIAAGAPLGPGSLLWSIASDPRGLIPGTAAGIMQLMLPGLGAGVTDHSNFFDDPFDRIFRSIPVIWGSIFAPDDGEGDQRGHHIRDLHRDIKGTDSHGHRYHALDPDIFWWAHATFTWEFFRARELYVVAPFRRSDREQLYAETVTWYRRYGVSDRPVPADLDAFRDRFDHICRHELELTPAVEWVLDPEKNSAAGGDPVRLRWPFSVLDGVAAAAGSELLRTLVFGGMPDIVRRRFDFPWSNRDRAAFVAVCGALRAMGPAIQRGALAEMYPEGTPHLRPGSRNEIVLAGPARRRRTGDDRT